jgi:phage gp46-like protein
VSLFTDRLAEPSDPLIAAPDGTVDRRGWWGDTLLAQDHPNDRIGSRLWLLERSKSDRNLPKTAEGYIREALQWLLDDGIATLIDAKCAFINGDTSMLRADVVIEHQTGRSLSYRYDWAWTELGGSPFAPGLSPSFTILTGDDGTTELTGDDGTILTGDP